MRVFLISLLLFFLNFKIAAEDPRVVARIGEKGMVSEEDIADWQATQACYPEGLTSRKAGFMRELEATVMEEILEREGNLKITDQDYEAEQDRARRESRAPEILACIENHFAGDNRRYWRVFLRPLLANKMFYDFAAFGPLVQKKAYENKEKATKLLKKGKSFEKIARSLDLTYAKKTFFKEDPTASDPQSPIRWNPAQTDFIESYLKNLKPGEALKNPVESREDIQFARLMATDGNRYDFEEIVIAKINAQKWCGSLKKLPAQIADSDIKPWLAGIKGNIFVNVLEIK